VDVLLFSPSSFIPFIEERANGYSPLRRLRLSSRKEGKLPRVFLSSQGTSKDNCAPYPAFSLFIFRSLHGDSRSFLVLSSSLKPSKEFLLLWSCAPLRSPEQDLFFFSHPPVIRGFSLLTIFVKFHPIAMRGVSSVLRPFLFGNAASSFRKKASLHPSNGGEEFSFFLFPQPPSLAFLQFSTLSC